MQIHATVNKNSAIPALRLVCGALSGSSKRRLMRVVGKGLEQDLQRHFLGRNREPNKRGWAKQNFWARIRNATSHAETTDDTATVTVSDPAMMAKLHGATIRPGPGKKALAIPMREEAYGVQPRSGIIPGLFVWRSNATGKAFLAAQQGKALRIYYLLLPRVTVPRDPRSLPPDEALSSSARNRVQSYLQRTLGGAS